MMLLTECRQRGEVSVDVANEILFCAPLICVNPHQVHAVVAGVGYE